MKSPVADLPLNLRFWTKGELAIDILTASYLDGLSFDFICGDEVYRACTAQGALPEDRGQAYVLRVPSNFTLSAPRVLGRRASGGYARAWLATASPRHSRLIHRYLKTGELAAHYYFVPTFTARSARSHCLPNNAFASVPAMAPRSPPIWPPTVVATPCIHERRELWPIARARPASRALSSTITAKSLVVAIMSSMASRTSAVPNTPPHLHRNWVSQTLLLTRHDSHRT